MEPWIKESEVNDICYKLCYACDEKISLDATDAEEILSLISKLISMNVDKRREEVEASIYECLGEASIIESLGEENIDETFVHYLTSTYAKVSEDLVTTYDFDSMGGNNSSSTDAQSEDSKIPMEGLVISNELKNELKNFRKWEFNVFNLVPHTPYPLAVTVETALDELKLISDLELNESKLRRFLIAIQESYQDLPYHNYMHGADVTQTIFHMCTEGSLMEALCVSNLGALAMIFGASIHDVNHPGLTGKFIVANSLPLAMTYNDQSPLENMHLATAFQLWSNQQNNFTEKMPRLLYKDLRKMIIDMVLATDNDMHFSLVGRLNEMISSGELSNVVQSQATAARSGTLGGSAMSTSGTAAGGTTPGTGGITAAGVRTNRLHSTESQYSSMKRMQSEHVAPGTVLGTGSGGGGGLAGSVFYRGSVNMSMEKLPINRKMSVTTGGNNNNTTSPDGTPRGRTNRVASIMMNNSTTGETSAYLPMKTQQLFVLQVALHAADISGPAKPWEVHMRWTSLVMDEFFKQGDKERELNVPITFAFDRYNMVPMPKFQLGFIKAIVSPLYKSLAKITGLSLQPALECLEGNSKKWESKIAL